MDNRQKNIIMGGILVIGGLVGCYTLYRKKKESQIQVTNEAPVPTRDQVLTVLANIAFQNECLIKDLSNIQDLTNPSVIDKMNEIRKIACTKGGVEEKVLRIVSERDFKGDRQILSLRNEAFTSYDKGIAILSAIQEKKGADFLTSELILDLLRKEYKERLYKIHEDLMELKKQGVVINIREPDADRFAVEAVLNDPKLQEIRNPTIIELGLDPSNKEYEEILEDISRLYMIQDKDDFMQKLIMMGQQSNNAIEAFTVDSPDAVTLIEEIGVSS